MIDTLKKYILEKNHTGILNLMVDFPNVIDQTDENGSSGLMLLAYSGLEEPFNMAMRIKENLSFHEAIVCGKKDLVVDYLTNSEKDQVHNHSSDGFSPLSLAAFFNQTEIAKLLLEKGADPNLSATNPSKVNALHSAVAKENTELIQLFLDNGADVNATQMQNVTALHSAVHRGNLALTKLLLKNGASADIKMDSGDTALSIAQREGYTELVDLLSKD